MFNQEGMNLLRMKSVHVPEGAVVEEEQTSSREGTEGWPQGCSDLTEHLKHGMCEVRFGRATSHESSGWLPRGWDPCLAATADGFVQLECRLPCGQAAWLVREADTGLAGLGVRVTWQHEVTSLTL